jgi:hypothetical protein
MITTTRWWIWWSFFYDAIKNPKTHIVRLKWLLRSPKGQIINYRLPKKNCITSNPDVSKVFTLQIAVCLKSLKASSPPTHMIHSYRAAFNRPKTRVIDEAYNKRYYKIMMSSWWGWRRALRVVVYKLLLLEDLFLLFILATTLETVNSGSNDCWLKLKIGIMVIMVW